MRWSIIRLIWFRELRDQLRDRRTIFMIAVLPILLYPLLGLGMMQLARGLLGKPNVIGILGSENLPRSTPVFVSPWPLAPADPLAGIPPLLSAAGIQLASRQFEYPALLIFRDGQFGIDPLYLDNSNDEQGPEIVILKGSLAPLPRGPESIQDWLDKIDRTALDKDKSVDVILVVPPTFAADLE